MANEARSNEARELIDEKFKGVHARIDASHDIIMLELRAIKEQTMKTNGRVTCLENETKFTRMMERRPVMIVIFILGIITLYGVVEISGLIEIMK
jgi:hypothetical protein